MIELRLPYPPSVNKAFRNKPGGGRARSKGYNAWRKEACAEISLQKPGKISGPYALHIQAKKPDNRKRDIDNLIKPCSDILVLAGVVRDDADCMKVSAEWVERPRGVVAKLEAL
ncbi:MAG: RusA family crossover junction endodeoxyribonuclease [Pseudomonadota bacterium]